jgi:hypothetical protein
MAVPAVNISIEKGADFNNTFTINDSDGSVFNLSGYTATAKIRKYPESPTSQSFTVGITSATGEITLSMGSTTTILLSNGRNYYDVLITSDENIKTRVIEGTALVSPSVSD